MIPFYGPTDKYNRRKTDSPHGEQLLFTSCVEPSPLIVEGHRGAQGQRVQDGGGRNPSTLLCTKDYLYTACTSMESIHPCL